MCCLFPKIQVTQICAMTYDTRYITMQRSAKMCAMSRITVQRHTCNERNMCNERKNTKICEITILFICRHQKQFESNKKSLFHFSIKKLTFFTKSFTNTHFNYQITLTVQFLEILKDFIKKHHISCTSKSITMPFQKHLYFFQLKKYRNP